MRAIWGPVAEIRDLGVVAEHCPYCEQVRPCLLRSVCRGNYVLFVKTTAPAGESSCLCTACLKAFPCERWRYTRLVPVGEAKTLAVEDLLQRTNPGLAERRQLNEQISALEGDCGFATAYQQLEGMRPGAMRSRLLKQLLHWATLAQQQRGLLGRQISAHARAWHFARQIGPTFPDHPGCLPAALAAPAVASVFLWLPAAPQWLAAGLTLAAGVVVAGFLSRALLKQRVWRWTRQVLVPEAQDAGVSLPCFLAVVSDVCGTRLGMMEELWPIKVELETIQRVLIVDGKLEPRPPEEHAEEAG
jgi:hypothetical protein